MTVGPRLGVMPSARAPGAYRGCKRSNRCPRAAAFDAPRQGRRRRFFVLKKATMPTAKKEATIEELRQKLGASKNLFFTNYAGLTVGDITKLRNELRKDGTS